MAIDGWLLRAVGAVWLARVVDIDEVRGPNPLPPTPLEINETNRKLIWIIGL